MALGDYPQQTVPQPAPQPAPTGPTGPTGLTPGTYLPSITSGTTSSTPATPQQSVLDQLLYGLGTYDPSILNQAQGVYAGQQRAALQNPYDVSGFGLAGQLLGLQQGQTASDYGFNLQQLGLSQTGEAQTYQQQLAQNDLAQQIQAQANLQQTQAEQSGETARGSTVSSGADTARSNIAAQNAQVLQQLGLQRTAATQAHQLAGQEFGLQGRQLSATEANKMAQYGVQQAQNSLSQNLTQALFGFDQADMSSQLSMLAGALGINEATLQQQLLSSGVINPSMIPGNFSAATGDRGFAGIPTGLPPSGPGSASQYQPMVSQAAQQYGVPAQLLDAIFAHESSFNPSATGDQGTSFGLAQIHLPAHPGITQAQADNPAFAINWTGQELGAAFKQFNGNIPATILYHNDPSGAVYLARTGQYRTDADRQYVQAVMAEMGQ